MPGGLVDAGLTALGTYAPARVVTNAELALTVDTSDEWIQTRTGIKARHIAREDEFVSDLAVSAVQNLVNRYGPQVLDGVDLVVVATNTPDALFPSTAALVQTHFGLNAGAFDLLAACPGWVYALSSAAAYVQSGMRKKVLAIGSEAISKITDWSDRATCVLFGDGACAGIVEAVPEGFGFRSFVLGADGAGGKHLHLACTAPNLPDGTPLGQKLYMNGREVYKFAVRVMHSATLEALTAANLALEDVALFVPHQANYRIIDAARESLGLPEDKIMANVADYGNTSTASIGLALREALDAGRVRHGDQLVLVSFGAGLTWASCALRWHAPQ